MKKTKLMALVLVVALMLMGVGYAAWTDKIEVDSTVTTGKMSVKVSEASSWAYIVDKNFDSHNNVFVGIYQTEDAYQQDIIKDIYKGYNFQKTKNTDFFNNGDSKKISSDFTNIVPGMCYETDVKMKNESTHPVSLDEIKFAISGDDEIREFMTADIRIEWSDENGNTKNSEPYKIKFFQDKSLESSQIGNLENLLNTYFTDQDRVLNKNEQVLIQVRYKYSCDALNVSQEKSITADMKCHFIQANLAGLNVQTDDETKLELP